MVDAHDRLPDEVQSVPEEQVVCLVDAPRLRVVHRHEPPACAANLDRLEHLADRQQRPVLRVGEKRDRTLLRERARLALVRSDVHHQSLRMLTHLAPRVPETPSVAVNRHDPQEESSL